MPDNAIAVSASPIPPRNPGDGSRPGPIAWAVRRRGRLIVAGAATIALCAAGTGASLALTTDPAAGYRTAVVSLGSVDQSVALSGTLASATRRDVAFGVGGTVASVPVAVGDSVTAGQHLATLEPSDLDDAVTAAQEAVTTAEEQLESDLSAQSSGGTTTSDASSSEGTGSDSAGRGDAAAQGDDAEAAGGEGENRVVDAPALQAAIDAVTSAQEALLRQYELASTALADSQGSVAASEDVCRPFLVATLGDADESEPDETAESPTPDGASGSAIDSSTDGAAGAGAVDAAASEDAASGSLSAIQSDLAACQQAIAEVHTRQSATGDAQSSVPQLMTELDRAVSGLQQVWATLTAGPTSVSTPVAGPSSSATADTASAESSSGTAGDTASATPDSGIATGNATSVTAETIVADRAEIDMREAQRAIAQHQRTLAELTSPISGTVAAVSMAVGDAVTAESATAVVTVIGDDGYVVSASVGLTAVGILAVGQVADIDLTGSDTALTGVVSSLGVLDTAADSSTPSYDVTIALDPADAQLRNGASAQVDVAVADQSGVLTVPTSSVHRDGSDYSVDLAVGGDARSTPVEIGAMGAERTEIVSGLEEGDEVVLADLSATVPGTEADTEASTGLTGLGGGTGTQGTGAGPTGGFPGGAGGGTPPARPAG